MSNSTLYSISLSVLKSLSDFLSFITAGLIQKIYGGQHDSHDEFEDLPRTEVYSPAKVNRHEPPVVEHDEDEDDDNYLFAETVEEEETLRLDEKEIELIKKALERNKGKRKAAADELGISERTLYRKIKQFNL